MRVTYKNDVSRLFIITAAVVMAVIVGALATIQSFHQVKATPTPDICFTFNDETQTITDYDSTIDPGCVSDLVIPETINGVSVRIIGSEAFYENTITSVVFPESIRQIEGTIFEPGTTSLNSITLHSDGDLVLDTIAFMGVTYLGGDLAVSAAGDLSYGGGPSFDGSAFGMFSLEAGGELRVESGSGLPFSATTTSFSGDIVYIGHSTGGDLSTESLNITAESSLSFGTSFGSAIISDITMTSGGPIAFSVPAFSDTEGLETITISAAGDITAPNGIFQRSSAGDITIESTNGLVDILIMQDLTPAGKFINLSINARNGVTLQENSFRYAFDSEAISITSGGNVSFGASTFYQSTLNTLYIDAEADVSLASGSLAQTQPSAVEIAAGGSIAFSGGNFSADNLKLLDLDAGENIAIPGGSFYSGGECSGVESFSLNAGGDLSITSGLSFCLIDSFTMTSGGDLFIGGGGFNGLTVGDFSLTSGGSLTIGEGTFGSLTTDTMHLNGGSITTTGGTLSNVNVHTFDAVSAGDIIHEGGSFSTYGGVGVLHFDLQAGGDIVFQSGVTPANVVTLNALADGDITLYNGSFNRSPNLESVVLTAGGSLTIEGAVMSNGNTVSGGVLKSAKLHADGNMTLGYFAMGKSQLENLQVTAGGVVLIAEGFAQSNKLRSLTLPAGLTSIGAMAFTNSKLEEVTLLGTPTLGFNVFGIAGVTYDTVTNTTSDYDKINFVALYADPSAGYTDQVYQGNIDGTSQHVGGYIVNPAQVTIRYIDENGSDLRSSLSYVGTQADSSLIHDYLISSNPDYDTSLYLKAGDSITVAPIDIGGYIKPAAKTVTLDPRSNTIVLQYTTPTPPPTTPSADRPSRAVQPTSPSDEEAIESDDEEIEMTPTATQGAGGHPGSDNQATEDNESTAGDESNSTLMYIIGASGVVVVGTTAAALVIRRRLG